jgi:hypothetical protein
MHVRKAHATALVERDLDVLGHESRAAHATHMLAQVICAMVERAVSSAMPGLKSRQQSAGPYSFTDSYANPTGDLYLLASERRDLGIGRARMGCMRPHVGYGG